MKNLFLLIVIAFLAIGKLPVGAQDLEDLLAEATEEEEVEYTSATFKATRIMNGHSIERMPEGQLDFRIHHRFGRLNSGAYELWGLDQANIHFSLEYGITDWLMVGVGRGTYEKTYDSFVKLSLLRQSSGARMMPVSVTFLSGLYLNSLRWEDESREYRFAHRLEFVNQLLIARKFNQSISLQIMPTHLHRNLVPTELDPNDLFALGVGGRIKLTSRISFNAEYYYTFRPENNLLSTPLHNPLALGFDIETGGHVFQLVFTNSLAMTEHGMIGNTTGNWTDGDIHFGFNISRVFMLK
jgi:hypothetical protein